MRQGTKLIYSSIVIYLFLLKIIRNSDELSFKLHPLFFDVSRALIFLSILKHLLVFFSYSDASFNKNRKSVEKKGENYFSLYFVKTQNRLFLPSGNVYGSWIVFSGYICIYT